MLFSDGSFAYKRKNNSDKIKLHIKPADITKLSRAGNLLTILTDIKEDIQLMKEHKV